MASQYGLYAYGLVSELPGPLTMAGIDNRQSIYAIEEKGLRVLVSNIDVDAFQSQVKRAFAEFTGTGAVGAIRHETAALLQAHEDVVDALMQQTTVVPFKFGTLLKDEAAASRMLLDDEERFNQLLARFAGRAEWGLKVYADTGAFTQHIASSEPGIAALQEQRANLAPGAAYLLGKKLEQAVKEAVAARLAGITETIFRQAGKGASEAKLNQTLPQKLTGKQQEMILNAAYLVETDRAARFCQQSKELQEHFAPLGLELEVSGPWPPYNFTSL